MYEPLAQSRYLTAERPRFESDAVLYNSSSPLIIIIIIIILVKLLVYYDSHALWRKLVLTENSQHTCRPTSEGRVGKKNRGADASKLGSLDPSG